MSDREGVLLREAAHELPDEVWDTLAGACQSRDFTEVGRLLYQSTRLKMEVLREHRDEALA